VNGPRVVVGMSGGVDSSVAAALLVEAGCEVVGVTMHLAGSASRCCSLDDADDARRVAEQLGIRFFVANYTREFRAEVMLPFADAYLAGRTPLPCATCNSRFKFDHLLARARALGAELVATGHYARVGRDEAGRPTLRAARDAAKDQSYFLYGLAPAQLAHTRFPLGALTKPEVRARARALGLATADKAESQELCFVPDGDTGGAVERLRPERTPAAGEIVDEVGRVLGRHGGVHRYTVGQRRGLGVSGAEPLYVKAIDAARNRVLVTHRSGLETSRGRVERVSWIAGEAPREPFRARVRIRYRHEGAQAVVTPHPDGSASLRFAEPVRALAPGQAAVFYSGDRVLGGGPIAGRDEGAGGRPKPS
jgi:tRNA-uridine 2-sulfurtransferase